jgi:hypothetical protein
MAQGKLLVVSVTFGPFACSQPRPPVPWQVSRVKTRHVIATAMLAFGCQRLPQTVRHPRFGPSLHHPGQQRTYLQVPAAESEV